MTISGGFKFSKSLENIQFNSKNSKFCLITRNRPQNCVECHANILGDRTYYIISQAVS